MQIKVYEILAAYESLRELARMKFRGALAFQIARVSRRIQEEFLAYNKQRDALIERHGEKQGDSDRYQINPDSPGWKAFQDEHEELMASSIDVAVDALALPEDMDYEPRLIVGLGPLVAHPPTEPAPAPPSLAAVPQTD